MPFDSPVSADVYRRIDVETDLLSQIQHLHDQADALAVMQEELRGTPPLLIQELDQTIAAFQNFAVLVKEARALIGAR
jgi:hypothetical protein